MDPNDPTPLRFPCHCGHRFALAADLAGDTIQCPACGILNDIPSLQELRSYDADGTVLLRDDPAPRVEANRVADLAKTFSRRTDKDLRNTRADLAAVGAGPLQDTDVPDAIPLAPGGPSVPKPKRVVPKYDPETGELVRAIPVAPLPADEVAAGAIPVAKRAIDYATVGTNAPRFTLGRVMVEMLMPVNMIVLLFTFLFYFFFLIVEGFFGPIIMYAGGHPRAANVLMAFFLLAHYANTIDDIGRNDQDELPRPLRGVGLADDVWGSFVSFAAAIVLCFTPAMFLNAFGDRSAWPLTILLAGAGLIAFPAVLITTVTAGTMNNLRPDRVLRTARAMGRSYVTALILWGLALPMFAFSLFDLFLLPEWFRAEHPNVIYMNLLGIRLPAIGLSIYFMHLACWHLGLAYRRHSAGFGWVLQAHAFKHRAEDARHLAEARAKRRTARP
ncbi:MAG TPA: hypothetical protein VEA69_03595 [Tepidisphaeraceae bacterium]|nr:hypothetical protein [Tepidisphaeraceae bacterium]